MHTIYNRHSGVAVDYISTERGQHFGVVVAYYILHGRDRATGWVFDDDEVGVTSAGDIIAGDLGTVTEANGPIYQAIRNALNLDYQDRDGSRPAILPTPTEDN